MDTATRNQQTDTPPASHLSRTVLIGAATMLLVALGVGIVLASRTRTYAEGTPEHVAQAYLQALFDQQPAVARQYLAPELATGCGRQEPRSWWIADAGSVRFADVRRDDGGVTIDLELASLATLDPFSLPFDLDYDPTRDAELVLEQRDGAWVITEAAWPLHQCDLR